MYVGKYPAFCICCLILNLNYAIHRRSWLVNGFFSLFLFAASQFSRFVYIGRTCLCGIHYALVSHGYTRIQCAEAYLYTLILICTHGNKHR